MRSNGRSNGRVSVVTRGNRFRRSQLFLMLFFFFFPLVACDDVTRCVLLCFSVSSEGFLCGPILCVVCGEIIKERGRGRDRVDSFVATQMK